MLEVSPLAEVEYRETNEGFEQFIEYMGKVHHYERSETVLLMNKHPDILRSAGASRMSMEDTANLLIQFAS